MVLVHVKHKYSRVEIFRGKLFHGLHVSVV